MTDGIDRAEQRQQHCAGVAMLLEGLRGGLSDSSRRTVELRNGRH